MPPTPTGFSFTAGYPVALNTTITLQWDQPQSPGPEAVVDYYEIVISSRMQSFLYMVTSSPWNVILDYSVSYNASIAAINCAGKSSLALLYNIQLGNYYKIFTRNNLKMISMNCS